MDSEIVVGSEIVLHGFVGDDFMDEGFTPKSVLKALANMPGDVTVRLNSGGGVAWDGAAIYAALKAHKGNVTVRVEGVAASAASLIAMAGDEIVMADGAMMMIHDPSALTIGTAEDHRQSAGVLDKLGETYAGVYAARSGKSAEDARALMLAETWMTADEAVEMGFADRKEGAADAVAAFPFAIYANAPEQLKALAHEKGWHPATPAPGQKARNKEAMMADDKVAGKPNPAESEAVKPQASKPEKPTMSVEDVTKATAKAVADERERASGIRKAVAAARLAPSMADALIDEGVSLDAARARIIEAWAENGDSHEYAPRPTAKVLADATDKFAEGATKALMARAGMKDGERNEFSGMSLLEIARASLEVRGEKVKASSKLDVAGAAFGVRMAAGHSTSDFPSILENIANKSMLRGFEEQEETFERWTSTGTLPDFKQAKRVGIDAFPSLAKVEEGAEYTYATVGDFAEPIVLATYGKLFKITRQVIVNDDLSAMTRIPQMMGRAARRTVGNLAYAVLTDNAAMSDGTALFASGHSNLAASGAVPSVTTMEAAIAAMATQQDRSGNATALNIRPAYILAPYALRGTVMQLLESEWDPAKTQRAANTVRNVVEPIFDARLDTNDAAAWYLAASPMAADTVEVSYLDGNSSPFLDSEDGWNIDGVEFKVRIDAAASALAWEGLYKNPGD